VYGYKRSAYHELKARVLPLLERITEDTTPPQTDLWAREYPEDKQEAFALEIAQKFGYDLNRGRFDKSEAVFEVSFTREDVRITTRYDRNYLPRALLGAWHETGHALYEQAVDATLTRSALTTDFLGLYAVGGASYGTHESQSRLWETHVARSWPFWQLHFPRLREFFPEQWADIARLTVSVPTPVVKTRSQRICISC
jgi:carboxypeptidase Taq